MRKKKYDLMNIIRNLSKLKKLKENVDPTAMLRVNGVKI